MDSVFVCKGVVYMSGISWNSTSISSYINNSLGSLKNTTCSNIYSNLGDSALIKSGQYKKLMSAYYKKKASESESETEESTSSSSSTTTSSSSTSTSSVIDTLV